MKVAVSQIAFVCITAVLASHSLHAEPFEFTEGESTHWLESVVEPETEMLAVNYVESTADECAVEPISYCCGIDCVDCNVDRIFSNTEISVGFDAFQNLGDTARTLFNPLPFANKNNLGAKLGFNTGYGLGNSKVRGQFGMSYGVYDWRGRVNIGNNSAGSSEKQIFLTAGAYKRSDVCEGDRVSWGVVYDHLFAENWGIAANDMDLGQIRGIVGYALNCNNEVGVWGTINMDDDSVILGQRGISPASQIRAMQQVNLFLKHNWDFGGNSQVYIGAFDSADVASWQFGAMNTAPLSEQAALYGNFNYLAPSAGAGNAGAAEEAWNVSAGLVFYLGRNAQSCNISGNQGMPLLPVASNGTFLITD